MPCVAGIEPYIGLACKFLVFQLLRAIVPIHDFARQTLMQCCASPLYRLNALRADIIEVLRYKMLNCINT
jgi:hypothetical protein